MMWVVQVVVVLVCFFVALDLVRSAPVLSPRSKWLLSLAAGAILILVLLSLAGLTGAPPTWLRH